MPHDGDVLARRVLAGYALHQLRVTIVEVDARSGARTHMHGVMPALFGFPAPWPPRAGEPRPSLSFVCSFVPLHGKFLESDPLVTKVPGTAEPRPRCVPARYARSSVQCCMRGGPARFRQSAA